jgi:hypothetical protein
LVQPDEKSQKTIAELELTLKEGKERLNGILTQTKQTEKCLRETITQVVNNSKEYTRQKVFR